MTSRRAAEQLIAGGHVSVNGVVITTPGTLVDPEHDVIAVDGQQVALPEKPTYILLNKPRGFVTTARDERGRRTVLDLVPRRITARVFPVGRLDLDTEGLLLLTDDGDLAHRLTHPRFEQEKEYLALVRGRPDAAAVRRLREGVAIDGKATAPAGVQFDGSVEVPRRRQRTWLRIVLREGRKRQVRRMLQAVGHPVERLLRVREGSLALGSLLPGRTRELTRSEVKALRSTAGLEPLAVSRPGRHAYNRPGAVKKRDEARRKRRAGVPRSIAIDGPGASGKSAVGQRVAEVLGYRLVDTGLMYRAVAWVALRRGIDPSDAAALGALAREIAMDVGPATPGSMEQNTVTVDGLDATPHLREPEVEAAVSLVSRVPSVRRRMVALQRKLAGEGPGVVMIGRDIGTVVLASAPLKVYLDASPEVRARRRREQLQHFGKEASGQAIAQAISRRDAIDSTRETSPLRAAPDAHVIDTGDLTLEQVVERVLELART